MRSLTLFSFALCSVFARPSLAVAKCKTVAVLTHDRRDEASQCWSLDDGNWYGGGAEVNQNWPINDHTHQDTPMVSGGRNGDQFTTNSRLWLNSNGFTVGVGEDVPLFLRMDPPGSENRRLCLVAKNEAPYPPRDEPPTLRYTICAGNNLTQLYLDVASSFFPSRSSPPDTQFFSSVVWSTSVDLRGKEDASTVVDYAKHIVNFVGEGALNVLRISDAWESCFGEFQFSSIKFPDAERTISNLKTLGFRVALSVHPFVAKDCEAYRYAAKKHFLVVDNADKPVSASVATKLVSGLDFGLPIRDGMMGWWTERLKSLKMKNGVDSFFFDYGQVIYFKEAVSTFSNADYSDNYVGAASQFGPRGVVAVATGSTQKYALFVATIKASNDYDGLASVIPTAFQMGLAGYPFFIPDVVGGSASIADESDGLFLRWLQLSVFMPVLHLSRGPWNYNDRIVDAAKRLLELRKKFVSKFVLLAREAVDVGSPIVRPLWWIAPIDDDARTIKDQFLVGNDLMVAPVLNKSNERVVYFPVQTTWVDPSDETRWFAGGTRQSFTVPLEKILYFIRI